MNGTNFRRWLGGRGKIKFRVELPNKILYLELYSGQFKVGANKTRNEFVIGTDFEKRERRGVEIIQFSKCKAQNQILKLVFISNIVFRVTSTQIQAVANNTGNVLVIGANF